MMSDFEEAVAKFRENIIIPMVSMIRTAEQEVSTAKTTAKLAVHEAETAREISRHFMDSTGENFSSVYALEQLWEMLDATNQTEAVIRLKELLSKEARN